MMRVLFAHDRFVHFYSLVRPSIYFQFRSFTFPEKKKEKNQNRNAVMVRVYFRLLATSEWHAKWNDDLNT